MNEQEDDAKASAETCYSAQAKADGRSPSGPEGGGPAATAAAAQEALEERLDALLVGVRMSIRYHDMREGWFLRWHRLTQYGTILFAGGVAARLGDRFGDVVAWTLTVLLGLVVGANLVFRFEKKANAHHQWGERFRALEKSLGSSWKHALTWEDYERLYAERLDIETDETKPTMTLLSALCQFYVIGATRPDLRDETAAMLNRIPRCRRLLAHWWSQSEFVLRELGQIRPSN